MTLNAQLLTAEEVGEALKVPTASIRRMIAQGRLPVIRLSPRRIRIKNSDLTALIDARRLPAIGVD